MAQRISFTLTVTVEEEDTKRIIRDANIPTFKRHLKSELDAGIENALMLVEDHFDLYYILKFELYEEAEEG